MGRGGSRSPHSFPAAPVPARSGWEGSRSRGNRGHRWPHFLQYKPGFLRFLLGPSPGRGRGGDLGPPPPPWRGGGRPGSAPAGAGWVGSRFPGQFPLRLHDPPSQEVKPLLCPSLGVVLPIPQSLSEPPNTPPGSLSPARAAGRELPLLVALPGRSSLTPTRKRVNYGPIGAIRRGRTVTPHKEGTLHPCPLPIQPCPREE